MEDIVIDDFTSVDYSGIIVPLIVVYDKPTDYPEYYIARLFNCEVPTNVILKEKDIDKLRYKIPLGFTMVPPDPRDDKNILEVWV